MIMAEDFKITKEGTIVREDQTNMEIAEIAEKEEISSLEECVFRHPEFYSEQKLSEKKKRLDELWKKYGLEEKEVSLLEYSVYTHPERCSVEELDKRRKRLDELWKKYGKADNYILKLKIAQKKVDILNKKNSSNSVLKNVIFNLKNKGIDSNG